MQSTLKIEDEHTYRWPFWGWAGASCSSSTQPSLPCRSTWLPCWPRPASTPHPCLRSEWCPSWTRWGCSRTRWTSWPGCRWTRQSTAVSRPLHCSHQVSVAALICCYWNTVCCRATANRCGKFRWLSWPTFPVIPFNPVNTHIFLNSTRLLFKATIVLMTSLWLQIHKGHKHLL